MNANLKNNKIRIQSLNKQKGATLFTALVFLALMTIVSVSAAKISMLDVLVSGNNQQQLELFQKTAREINAHTSAQKLLTMFQTVPATENAKIPFSYDFPDKPNTRENITNRALVYSCEGIRGAATSQGSDNICHLFDFGVRTTKQYSSARDRHYRGGGKEYPSPSRNNFNN